MSDETKVTEEYGAGQIQKEAVGNMISEMRSELSKNEIAEE